MTKSLLPTLVETRHTGSLGTGTTREACQQTWTNMYVITTLIGELLALRTRPLASSNYFQYRTAYSSTYLQTLTPLIGTNMGITMYQLLWTACRRNLFLFLVIRQLLLRKQLPYLSTTCSTTLALQTLLSQTTAYSLFQPFRLSSVKYLALRLSCLQPTTLKLTVKPRL